MNTTQTMMIEKRLEFVIDRLNSAVNVCNDVDSMSENYEQSYPFATGYSRSSMEGAIGELTKLLNEYKTVSCEESI
jgi:hypothetical protein